MLASVSEATPWALRPTIYRELQRFLSEMVVRLGMMRMWVHEYRTSLEPAECDRRLSDPTSSGGMIIIPTVSSGTVGGYSVGVTRPLQIRRYSELLLEVESTERPTILRVQAKLDSRRVIYALVWTAIVIPFIVITHDLAGKIAFTTFWLAPLFVIVAIAVRHSMTAEQRIAKLLSATRRSRVSARVG